jgi:BMFP domain-containing protein YqiC
VSDDDTLYEQSVKLAEKLGEIMHSCRGIEVVECELRLKSEVTLEDLDLLQRWDFDSLTIRQTDTMDQAPKDL